MNNKFWFIRPTNTIRSTQNGNRKEIERGKEKEKEKKKDGPKFSKHIIICIVVHRKHVRIHNGASMYRFPFHLQLSAVLWCGCMKSSIPHHTTHSNTGEHIHRSNNHSSWALSPELQPCISECVGLIRLHCMLGCTRSCIWQLNNNKPTTNNQFPFCVSGEFPFLHTSFFKIICRSLCSINLV